MNPQKSFYEFEDGLRRRRNARGYVSGALGGYAAKAACRMSDRRQRIRREKCGVPKGEMRKVGPGRNIQDIPRDIWVGYRPAEDLAVGWREQKLQ